MTILSGIAQSMQLMLRRPQRRQYAALCYRDTSGGLLEILLLTSRDTGRWVIPKGWPMGAKAGHEVAAQEALEEAGVTGEAGATPLGTYRYQKRMQDDFSVPCGVEVYPMRVTGFVDSFKEKGKRQIDWVSPKEAAARVAEPELTDLILRFAASRSPSA
ncbi:NUDIX hydrolase [Rhizobium sp. FKL33]|uniref:NUDIX hydrolase n=1 Tax=Rhizobium sp. FKL33 TaxID=2562307 RepID=UPI0010C11D94|nr:NUDIX hydrolase [Rhizobium sp. FKL33]